MMTSLHRRPALDPWYGQTVKVECSVDRVGRKRWMSDSGEPRRVLNAHQIIVEGQPVDVDYLWLPMGPTAAARVAKMEDKGQEITAARFRAMVFDYESDGGPSYCFERLQDMEVLAGGKWRHLISRPEWVYGAIREQRMDQLPLQLECLARLERQREYVERYAARPHRRKDKVATAILDKFLVRGEPLSDKQFHLVQREVESAD